MKKWKNMEERVDDYLNARRNLGYKLQIEGMELYRFAQFSKKIGHSGAITIDLAIAWANSSKKGSDLYRARRIEIVRGLSKYCSLFEPENEIPPTKLLGPAHRRVTPYIYTEKEIVQLLNEANNLFTYKGIRPASIRCVLGLLAATGLRVSEAIHLAYTDVDLNNMILTIRETKFCKSRYVPLHHTTVKVLADYVRLRDRQIPIAPAYTFFIGDNGLPLNYRQVLYAFQCIRRKLGWEMEGRRNPRIHDLRHTFACHRLLAWYKEGVNVDNAITMLSVYLGHAKVTDTYWYITGIPELMAIAIQRFENNNLKIKEVCYE